MNVDRLDEPEQDKHAAWIEHNKKIEGIPLYNKPQAKKWVGLTKQEYDDIYASNKDSIYEAMMVVATYLKRKNK